MATYRITPRALSDLKSIGRYTTEKWGKPQRNRYLADLDKRFNWLAKHPHLGKHRADIAEGSLLSSRFSFDFLYAQSIWNRYYRDTASSDGFRSIFRPMINAKRCAPG
ncbi:MAG: type II toxin-antitoxin system RelE/ParE family toxin [Methylomonas sp.]|nr:type II toxin-antitoxin system RelE/ParE family toxin [Methylomonas sp.]